MVSMETKSTKARKHSNLLRELEVGFNQAYYL